MSTPTATNTNGCWSGFCIAGDCDGINHVDATGYTWAEVHPDSPATDTARMPKPVREMAALVVLACDLPMPVRISFQGTGTGEAGTSIMSMSLRTVAEGQAWSRHLGGRTDTYVSAGTGRTWLDEGLIKWHGWSVQLHASDDLNPGQSLDPATAAGLEAIAGGSR
jgi:hypothetical protein